VPEEEVACPNNDLEPILFVCSVAVVGCGGSGNGSTAVTGGKPTTTTLGPFQIKANGAIPTPVIMGGRNTVVTGIAGASLSGVLLNLAAPYQISDDEVLSSTNLTFSVKSRPFFYDYGSGKYFQIGTLDCSNGFTVAYWPSSYPSASPNTNQIAANLAVATIGGQGTPHCCLENIDGSNFVDLGTAGDSDYDDLSWCPTGDSLALTPKKYLEYRIILYASTTL
jgi:hypothetical protein